jgi:hypothetical protein
MVNNSTNINKTNNYCLPQIIELKNMLEFQVLSWDMHKKCGRIKPVYEISTPHFDNLKGGKVCQ